MQLCSTARIDFQGHLDTAVIARCPARYSKVLMQVGNLKSIDFTEILSGQGRAFCVCVWGGGRMPGHCYWPPVL